MEISGIEMSRARGVSCDGKALVHGAGSGIIDRDDRIVTRFGRVESLWIDGWIPPQDRAILARKEKKSRSARGKAPTGETRYRESLLGGCNIEDEAGRSASRSQWIVRRRNRHHPCLRSPGRIVKSR